MSIFRSIFFALTLILAGGSAFAQQAEPFTPEQKAAMQALVREILIKNPEILIEAMQALEAKQQDDAGKAAKAAIAEHRKDLLDDGVSFVAGNPKGDVTIVEFFDYRCPYCKQVVPALQQLIKEDKKLRVVFKELPVLGPDSIFASRAAIAAIEQDKGAKYMAFHDAMMAHRGQLTEAEVLRLAGEAGLKLDKLKADMMAPKTDKVIRDNLTLADKLGIRGTPGFVIGDELVPGAIPLESLRQLVKAARG